MQIDKNTRLIDLKVSDLIDIIKECITSQVTSQENQFEEDEIGGYEIAEKITGYARQTLYQLKSSGQIPYLALPGGGVRFSKSMLIDWLTAHRKLTNQEIVMKAETLTLKRKLRRK